MQIDLDQVFEDGRRAEQAARPRARNPLEIRVGFHRAVELRQVVVEPEHVAHVALIAAAARLPTLRGTPTLTARFVPVIATVTGGPVPISRTRMIVQACGSTSNGRSPVQPWLNAVRSKLKSRGVGIVISIVRAILVEAASEIANLKSLSYPRRRHIKG